MLLYDLSIVWGCLFHKILIKSVFFVHLYIFKSVLRILFFRTHILIVFIWTKHLLDFDNVGGADER